MLTDSGQTATDGLTHARHESLLLPAASLVTRRRLLGSVIAAGCCARSPAHAQGAVGKTLRILDAIGNLPLTELGFELYTKEHPDGFSRLKFDEVPATKIDGIVKKGAAAVELLPDIVLVGADRMMEGVHRGSWQEILLKYASRLPNLQSIYIPPAWKMQNYADGHGLVLSYLVTGPVLAQSSSSTLPMPLKIADLLGWLRHNPGRFGYSRPTTSRAGRDFLMALPYLLGDAAPTDPVNGWDHTWSFLAELGTYIEQYPLSVKPLIAGLAARSLDVITCTFGEAFNARASEQSTLRLGAFDNAHWINDAHFAVIPTQVTPQRCSAIVDVLAFMLGQKAQGLALRQTSMFPGSAIADASLDSTDLPSSASTRVTDAAEFATLTEGGRFVPPLFGTALPYALSRWDRQIRLKQ